LDVRHAGRVSRVARARALARGVRAQPDDRRRRRIPLGARRRSGARTDGARLGGHGRRAARVGSRVLSAIPRHVRRCALGTATIDYRLSPAPPLSDTVIRVEHLAKQYRLGGPAQRFGTLREALTGWFRSPFRSARAERVPTIWALDDVSFEIGRGEVVGI